MPAIELQAICKSFGPTTVLADVSLACEPGDITAIVGSSGAGKTTLLRIIAGLEAPDAGVVRLHQRNMTELAPAQRQLAYLTQDYALYPQLSVRNNLEAALSPLKLARQDRQARIAEALARFQLAPVELQLPSQLSGGQAQRAALAKALVRRPQVLLLDEPLSQMDAALKEQLRGLLVELVRDFGITLLMVTHDPLDALSLATRVGVLERGSLVQCDSPAVVYQYPVSRSAAELLSPFGIHWLRRDQLPDQAWRVREGVSSDAPCVSSDAQWIGFRPEQAVLLAPASEMPPGSLCLDVAIEGQQSLGFAWLMRVRCGEHSLKCLTGDDPPPPGSSARLCIRSNQLLSLD